MDYVVISINCKSKKYRNAVQSLNSRCRPISTIKNYIFLFSIGFCNTYYTLLYYKIIKYKSIIMCNNTKFKIKSSTTDYVQKNVNYSYSRKVIYYLMLLTRFVISY